MKFLNIPVIYYKFIIFNKNQKMEQTLNLNYLGS